MPIPEYPDAGVLWPACSVAVSSLHPTIGEAERDAYAAHNRGSCKGRGRAGTALASLPAASVGA
jgi:hypothetical protein